MVHSLENTIVHTADIAYWGMMLAGGLIKDGTISEKYGQSAAIEIDVETG